MPQFGQCYILPSWISPAHLPILGYLTLSTEHMDEASPDFWGLQGMKPSAKFWAWCAQLSSRQGGFNIWPTSCNWTSSIFRAAWQQINTLHWLKFICWAACSCRCIWRCQRRAAISVSLDKKDWNCFPAILPHEWGRENGMCSKELQPRGKE